MKEPKPLSGRVCVVTGAAGGLGSAIVRRFLESGAEVLAVTRSAGASDPRVTLVHADLAEPAAVEEIKRKAAGTFGRVDVLVNAAAVQGPIGPLVENDWEEWERAFRIDFLAPVALCRALLPLMGDGGRIVNISGGGATSPRPNFTAYASAKAALVRFTETLAEEVRVRGIAVNALAPGAMKTKLLQTVIDAGPVAAGEREVKSAEHAEAATTERAADLALFLASRDSEGITGKLISAIWDPYRDLPQHLGDLIGTDLYTLRRITPADRGLVWSAE